MNQEIFKNNPLGDSLSDFVSRYTSKIDLSIRWNFVRPRFAASISIKHTLCFYYYLVLKQETLSLKSDIFSLTYSFLLTALFFIDSIVSSCFRWYIKSCIATSILYAKLSKYLLAPTKYFLTFLASDLFLKRRGLECQQILDTQKQSIYLIYFDNL